MNNENLPETLFQSLISQYGEKKTEEIIKGFYSKRKVTLRINTIRSNKKEVIDELNANNIQFTDVDFYKDALIIENSNESDIQKLNIYNEGKIYLQSLSSMIPVIMLSPNKRSDILDMAAAPGGKTTQLAAITGNEAYITACEINPLRKKRLEYNIEKQGATSVSIIKIDSRNLNDFLAFDKILLDAPCSGSGTINLNDMSKEIRYTSDFSNKLEKTQTILINKAFKILKKGGELVYSTCSILEKENENIINKILKTNQMEIVPLEIDKNIERLPSKIPGTLCIKPNELFEGFFVAKLRKI